MSVPVGKRSQSRLQVIVKAQELAVYSLQIVSNPKTFDPMYQNALGDDLISDAKQIFKNCWIANNVRVVTRGDFERRRHYQTEAILACLSLRASIELAHKLYHLDSKRVAHWGKMTVECADLIRAWRNSDKKRYDSS